MNKTKKIWQNLPTLQSKEILAALTDAKENQKAVMIIADTGLGKTNTVNMFVEKNPDATYKIIVGDSYKLDDILNELSELLGIEVATAYSTHGSTHRQKLKAIAQRLFEIGKLGYNPVVIFDEAENVKTLVLKCLKELYDAIIDYCGIVLIGTDQLYDNILNRKSKQRTSVPQLYRRFKAGIREIAKFKKARDMKPFFDRYIPKEEGIQALLVTLCENYGELHDYLAPVLLLAEKRKEPISEKLFRLYHNITG